MLSVLWCSERAGIQKWKDKLVWVEETLEVWVVCYLRLGSLKTTPITGSCVQVIIRKEWAQEKPTGWIDTRKRFQLKSQPYHCHRKFWAISYPWISPMGSFGVSDAAVNCCRAGEDILKLTLDYKQPVAQKEPSRKDFYNRNYRISTLKVPEGSQ